MYAKYSEVVDVKYGKRPTNIRKATALKQHHHVRIDQEFKADCQVWVNFLDNTTLSKVVCHPMVDLLGPVTTTSDDIFFYSDATAAEVLGFGCIFNNSWIYKKWKENFIKEKKPSIAYLELYALAIGLFTWEDRITDSRVVIFCDNMSVVCMINNITSKCKNCMFLLRQITLNGLRYNRRVSAKYVSTKSNFLADSLSRLDIAKFKRLAPPTMNPSPDTINDSFWPVSKIWID